MEHEQDSLQQPTPDDQVSESASPTDGLISWLPRYSFTGEPDDQGRWARVGFVHHPEAKKQYSAFMDGKPAFLQVAWISQVTHEDRRYFLVDCQFPVGADPTRRFSDLDEAKRSVEANLRWFMDCVGNYIPESDSGASENIPAPKPVNVIRKALPLHQMITEELASKEKLDMVLGRHPRWEIVIRLYSTTEKRQKTLSFIPALMRN